MTKLVTHPDYEINRYITNILEEIVEEIVTSFNPDSIILDGSFGHGEGAAIKYRNKIKILSDFDMALIRRKIIPPERINELNQSLSKKYKMKVDIHYNNPEKYLNPSDKNPSQRTSSPFVSTYSRKYGAVVLHGRDYLKMMPDCYAENIPYGEGMRILFNRMGELLSSLDIVGIYSNNLRMDMIEEEKLRFSMDKLIVACGEALLITNKLYHYSYSKKLDNLRTLIPKFSGTSLNLEKLIELFEDAVYFRINASRSESRLVTDLFFEVNALCDVVFRYMVECIFNFNFTDYIDFSYKYIKNINQSKIFYRGNIKSPIIQNGYYTYRLFQNGFNPKLKLLNHISTSMPQILYSVLPMVLFSISSDKIIKKAYIERAWHILAILGVNKKEYMSILYEYDRLCFQSYNLWKILHI